MISSNFVAINSDRATMIFCQLYFIMIKIFLKNQCINWIRQFHPPGVLKCIYVIGAIVVPSSVLWVMPAAQTHMFHWWKFLGNLECCCLYLCCNLCLGFCLTFLDINYVTFEWIKAWLRWILPFYRQSRFAHACCLWPVYCIGLFSSCWNCFGLSRPMSGFLVPPVHWLPPGSSVDYSGLLCFGLRISSDHCHLVCLVP